MSGSEVRSERLADYKKINWNCRDFDDKINGEEKTIRVPQAQLLQCHK